MAPISTLNTMTSTMGHSDLGHSLMAFDLPISRRGHFFQDSFFENAHEQFNSTVRKILQRWGETDFLGKQWDDHKLCLSNSLNRYRQLRTHNLKEEDQAVTVASDVASQKIVMDVHDFVAGEVKVKVAGERELVVEGRTETKDGDWSVSTNSFRRRFCLPANTDLKAVSAVLSDDGILTISAPRMAPALEAGHMEVPITREGMQAAAATVDSSSKVASSSSETTEAASCTCSHQQQTQSTASQESRGQIIPIQLDGSQEPQSPAASQTCETKVNEKVQLEKKESAVKNISETIRRAQHSESTAEASTASCTSPRPLFAPPSLRGRNIPIAPSSLLPITKRGRFFDDDFFVNMRQDFQSAVNDVLGRWGEGSVLGNGHDALASLGRYRQLRERNLGVESQAVNVSADQTNHKIVMDVNDFVSGEVKVKVAGEREVVVEGRTETKDGDCSVSTNSFRRRFCLPANTDVKAVSAVVSDDGVLTITVPKKTIAPAGSTIPIKVEGHKEIKIETATPSAPGTPATPGTPASPAVPQQQSSLTSTQTDAQVSGSVGTFAKENTSTKETTQTSSLLRQQPGSPTPRGLMLPITTRGLFFGDSFFKNTWQDFHEAVRDVVSKWGNFSADEDLSRYMTLRAADVKNENQAVKSTEDEANYKIVVDVQGFTKGGNITVRAVQDRELVVEGLVEQQEGGANYRKQFHRRFVLPHDIYPESVSSVMSADGVLTITAPKKPSTIQLKEVILPIAIEEGVNRTESLSQMPTPEIKSPTPAPVMSQPLPAAPAASFGSATTTSTTHQQATSQNVTSQSSQQVGGPREHIIPVSLEQSHPAAATGAALSRQAEVSQTVSQAHAATTSEAQVQQTAATESLQKESSSSLTQQQSEQSNLKLVPISHRGTFLNDSFFEDARRRFEALTQKQSALKPALSPSCSLLRRNFRLSEQEAHVEEDSRALKVTLDVNDFIGGEVKVGVEGGRAIVVEGQTSCEEGTSSSSRNFRRVFSLPRNADVAAVTSALSSDGVLTIVAPKLQQLAEAAAGSKEMASESHARQEIQGAGAQGWAESKVKEEVKESNGSSSKSYSSSYASQQQVSSQNVF